MNDVKYPELVPGWTIETSKDGDVILRHPKHGAGMYCRDDVSARVEVAAHFLRDLVTTCALRGAQKESGWISARDSLPPCDGETMFIGENANGYIACFNRLTPDGYCFHASAEDEICVMSGLRMWKLVDRPSPPTPEGEAK